MITLDDLFQQFLRERTYVQNVTPKTREWYQHAWRAFSRAQVGRPCSPGAPLISRSDLQDFVIHLSRAWGEARLVQYMVAGNELVLSLAPRARHNP